MVSCAAYGCTNRTDRKKSTSVPKITFHLFPKDVKMRQKWIDAVRRKNWHPSDTSRLCCAHFTSDCFDRTSVNITRLRPGSVPTIFPAFPSYLQKDLLEKTTKRKRKCPAIDEEPTSSASGCSGDIKEDVKANEISENSEMEQSEVPLTSSSHQERKNRFVFPTVENKIQMELIQKIRVYRRKVKSLQQTKRRQKQIIARMKNALKRLIMKNLLVEENVNVLSNITGLNKKILNRQVAKSRQGVSKTI